MVIYSEKGLMMIVSLTIPSEVKTSSFSESSSSSRWTMVYSTLVSKVATVSVKLDLMTLPSDNLVIFQKGVADVRLSWHGCKNTGA